jgi:hypothetical protein
MEVSLLVEVEVERRQRPAVVALVSEGFSSETDPVDSRRKREPPPDLRSGGGGLDDQP